MLPASVQRQAYRVSNATLDVVTGTEDRLSGRRPFSATERSARQRKSMDRGRVMPVPAAGSPKGASSDLCDEPADRERGRRPGAAYPLPKGWSTLNVRPVFTCGLAKML